MLDKLSDTQLRHIVSDLWNDSPQDQKTPAHVMNRLAELYPDQYDKERAEFLASTIA